jgi:arylsulfatase A-like enzyme
LLHLCGIDVPDTVEGVDFSEAVLGGNSPKQDASIIAGFSPFADWRPERGGKEYRGIRTERYTYVRDLAGPWLMYDNQTDPYQLNNLIGNAAHKELQAELDSKLEGILQEQNDEFLPAPKLREQWGYTVLDATSSIPFGD